MARFRRITIQGASVDERGASAVEYGLIVVAIAAVVAAIVFLLGIATHGLFKTSCDNYKNQVSLSQGGPGATC